MILKLCIESINKMIPQPDPQLCYSASPTLSLALKNRPIVVIPPWS